MLLWTVPGPYLRAAFPFPQGSPGSGGVWAAGQSENPTTGDLGGVNERSFGWRVAEHQANLHTLSFFPDN